MAQKDVRLTSGQKKIVLNVRTFFKTATGSIKREQVVTKTSLATGFGETMIIKKSSGVL